MINLIYSRNLSFNVNYFVFKRIFRINSNGSYYFFNQRSFPSLSSSCSSKMLSREWIPYNSAASNSTNTPKKQVLKLLSYNILAQDLLIEHMVMYTGINRNVLLWQYRLERLKEEINRLRPDILCLQEVQYNHLKSIVSKVQERRYFEYVFKKKSGSRTDGCAIIYDRSKLRLIAESPIEYYMHGHPVLNRDNVALLARFQLCHEPQTEFIVATTHLLYNPRREDVRTAQVEVLIRSLLDFALSNQRTGDYYLPIILTGDFNFTCNSPSFKVLTTPLYLSQYIGSQTNLTKNVPNSTFQLLPINFGEECASTYQDSWVTVDHILYSLTSNCPKYLKIFSVYKLPSIHSMEMFGKLPSTNQGSDHLPLVMTFSIV